MKTDVYQKITDRIVADLEGGTRPWMKPWNANNGEGRIMRPLRANGIPYQGINVLMLWSEAIEKGYAASIWMTFKQAISSLPPSAVICSEAFRVPDRGSGNPTPLGGMGPRGISA